MKTLLGMMLVGLLAGCETVPRQVLPYVMEDGSGGLDLYLYDLESGGSRVLSNEPRADEYDPSPDYAGTRIAYIAKDSSTSEGFFTLRIKDLQTGQTQEIDTSIEPIASPAFSNNGKQLAYVVKRNGKFQIHVKDLETKADSKIIGFGSDPSWRVDDRAIFYNSRHTPDEPAGDLTVHELKKGLNQSLALRGNGFANLTRGTSVVYTTLPYSRRNEAVWIIDANSRQQRLSSPGKTHRDTDPVHINGTKFVAFTRTDIATNESSIYVVERYATDPVETLLFESKGGAFTKRKQ